MARFAHDHDDEKGGAAIGCLILIIGGCACLGGLIEFFKFVYFLFQNWK